MTNPSNEAIADALREFLHMPGMTIGLVWKGWIEEAVKRLSDEPPEQPYEVVPVVNDAGQFFGMASPTSQDGQDSTWNGPRYVRASDRTASASRGT